MNESQKELLYRSYSGSITPAERALLDQALLDSADLRAEQSQIEAMHSLLSGAAAPGFSPFFPERVMNRLAGQDRLHDSGESIWEAVQSEFRWLAIAAAPVAMALFIWNANLTENADPMPIAPVDAQIEHSRDLWETPLESVFENLS